MQQDELISIAARAHHPFSYFSIHKGPQRPPEHQKQHCAHDEFAPLHLHRVHADIYEKRRYQ